MSIGRCSLLEADAHRQKLLLTDLSPQEAVQKSQLFARLIADFCLMDLIEIRRQGFSEGDVVMVTSIVRKNVFEYAKIAGIYTLEGGKYQISDLLSSAINNAEFVGELNKFILELFSGQESLRTEPHPLSELKGQGLFFSQVVHGHHIVEVDQPTVPVPPAALFSNLDVGLARKKLTNLIWRQCEAAIKSPSVALHDAFGPP